MSNLGSREFTCAETPLHLLDISLNDITVSSTSGIEISIDGSGPLLISQREKRDGINILERTFVATYRGQRYTSIDFIFHTPGLHIFPGQKTQYPCEYHIHMGTYSKPTRFITIVIPIVYSDFTINTPPPNPYFTACKAPQDASIKPSLATLIPYGSPIIQYQGPDLRGRTEKNPTNADCPDLTTDFEILMVTKPVYISEADSDRIRRGGYTGTNTEANQPVPGVAPSEKMPRTKILNQIVLAVPGIIDPNAPLTSPASTPTTTTTKTVSEIDIDVYDSVNTSLERFLFPIGIFIGFIIVDFISGYIWTTLFTGDAVKAWLPIKVLVIALCCIAATFWYRDFIAFTEKII